MRLDQGLQLFHMNVVGCFILTHFFIYSPFLRLLFSSQVWAMIEEQKLPLLGICYGMQEIAHTFGGEVNPSTDREFGRAHIEKTINEGAEAQAAAESLFNHIGEDNNQMWMSHGDKVSYVLSFQLNIIHSCTICYQGSCYHLPFFIS